MGNVNNTPDGKFISWNRPGVWCLISLTVGMLVLIMFRQFPEIDFYFSNVFFTEVPCVEPSGDRRCGRFPLSINPSWMSVREAGLALQRLMMVFVFVYLIWLLMFKPGKQTHDLTPPLIAVFSALLGPGLITSVILKEFWGRPRPWTTLPFSGDHPYVLPGDISSYCNANCSFVSGEATAAFWMLVMVLFLKARARIGVGILIGLLALGISMLRVGFGRHYISDVVMAGFIAVFSIFFVTWLLRTPKLSARVSALLDFSNARASGNR